MSQTGEYIRWMRSLPEAPPRPKNCRPSPDPVVRAEVERAGQVSGSEPLSAPPGMRTSLYRRYDRDWTLLYVGISDWPRERAAMHKASLWVQFAAHGKNEWFPTRDAAQAAEVAAIHTERPLFNRRDSIPGAAARLDEYLLTQGRQDLLVITAAWTWGNFGPRRRPPVRILPVLQCRQVWLSRSPADQPPA